MSENSGGDVNYYRVEVTHPKRTEPYIAECEDIIAHLGMDFFEGEAFKAAWRKAAQRTLGVGKEGNTALRDAQKMAHYGARCLAIEQHREMASEVAQVPAALPPEKWRVGDAVEFQGEGMGQFSKGQCYRLAPSPRGSAPGYIFVIGKGGFLGSWSYAQAAEYWQWFGRP